MTNHLAKENYLPVTENKVPEKHKEKVLNSVSAYNALCLHAVSISQVFGFHREE